MQASERMIFLIGPIYKSRSSQFRLYSVFVEVPEKNARGRRHI
jgi:hypothetical protein